MNILVLKEKFKEIVKSIKREGANIEGLLQYLEESDFYTAPASTQYNCSFNGGLLIHSLNQYYLLNDLCSLQHVEIEDKDSLKIIGLFNELYKTNFYELTNRRERIKKDDNSYEWVDVPFYKVKSPEQRLLCGDNAFNSFYILSSFIPLKRYEIMAIINQTNDIEDNKSDTTVLSHNPLVVLLRCANLINMYINENNILKEDFVYKEVKNE